MLTELLKNKNFLDKFSEVFKFCFGLTLLSILVIKVPNEAAQLLNVVAGFVLGGTKLRSKIGL